MRLLTLTLAASLVAPSAVAQFGNAGNDSGGPLHAEMAAYDVQHYDLSLQIDPDSRTIRGTLAMSAIAVAPTSHVRLHLDDALSVTGAFPTCYVGTDCFVAADEVLGLERLPGQVRVALGRTVQPGEKVAFLVNYEGTPRVAPRPPWDGGFSWATTADGQPWVAVSCQGEGADLWWPTKDHPSDEPDQGMTISLMVPSGLRAIANGRHLAREDNGDGTATERWVVTTPINNYGVSFGIGPYEEVTAQYESPLGYAMPVIFYVLPERRADAEKQLPGFLDALAFMERTFGPYGSREDGYDVIHTPYLGMEHQSLIAYGSTFEDNAYGFDWLHFHELAHEWWANLGTAPDWNDFWIHESFANYAEALYAEDLAMRRTGNPAVAEEAYREYLGQVRGQLHNAIPVAPSETRTTSQMYNLPGGGFNGDIYFKGSWFLHTLRFAMDDDPAFFRALRRILYPQPDPMAVDPSDAYRWVSTADVIAAFQAETELDVATIAHVYLRQPALPTLEVRVSESGSGYDARWVLPPGALPEGTAFELPIFANRIRIEMPGGVGEIPGFRSALQIDTAAALFDLDQQIGR